MTNAEAKRYAHKIVCDLIQFFDQELLDQRAAETRVDVRSSPDWPKIDSALEALWEQHSRFGPKSSDKVPRAPEIVAQPDTPLPFDSPNAEENPLRFDNVVKSDV